jgi:hypothetical protein
LNGIVAVLSELVKLRNPAPARPATRFARKLFQHRLQPSVSKLLATAAPLKCID